jgi:hypothetical protein
MPIFAGGPVGISWLDLLTLLAFLVLGPLFLIAGIRLYAYLAKKEKETKD